MTRIVGVRFRNGGKVYYFDPKDYEMTKEDHVIVETSRGMEYGRIVLTPREVEDDKVVHPLKEVVRVANAQDDERERRNREKEKEAFRVCQQKIREHQLDMKLIDAEYTFDKNKVLFYFTADGRIDFRQLVKDLASIFKTRIELRQIGVRDETKILGGIGICGRCLCCHSYLTDFAPVSIKMAKEQNLSLNQTKISGVCGRLMCCLKNEQQTYEELNKKLPGNGDIVTLPDGGTGVVHSVNVLRQTVKVVTNVDDEKEIQDYPVEELSFRPRKKKGKGGEDEESQEEQAPEKKSQEKPGLKQENRRPDGSGRKNKKSDKGEKKDGTVRGGREERTTPQDRGEKNDRNRRNDRDERNSRNDRGERNDRADRNDRGEKNERGERNDRPEMGEQAERRRENRRSENRGRNRGPKKGEQRRDDREAGQTSGEA